METIHEEEAQRLEHPCPYCKEQEVTMQDAIYQPPTVVCCEDDVCQQRAAWDLWIASNEPADGVKQ